MEFYPAGEARFGCWCVRAAPGWLDWPTTQTAHMAVPVPGEWQRRHATPPRRYVLPCASAGASGWGGVTLFAPLPRKIRLRSCRAGSIRRKRVPGRAIERKAYVETFALACGVRSPCTGGACARQPPARLQRAWQSTCGNLDTRRCTDRCVMSRGDDAQTRSHSHTTISNVDRVPGDCGTMWVPSPRVPLPSSAVHGFLQLLLHVCRVPIDAQCMRCRHLHAAVKYVPSLQR